MSAAQLEDIKWIRSHHSELQKKYSDMYVAVKDGKIIAVGRRFCEVYDKAKKVARDENFAIDYMLTGGVLGQTYLQLLRHSVQR